MHPDQINRTIKIAVIAGIRSQYMKLAALQKTIDEWNEINNHKILVTYINTGQHYDDNLAGVFIRELNIRFDADFTNEYKSTRPIDIFGGMIIRLYDYLPKIDPNWVIVFGDANTTLAGAIAASKRNIPLIHIEAGVRTGDKTSPEEINRILTDNMASVCFTSARKDATNLQAEGITDNVIWTGDLIKDLVERLSPSLPACPTGYSNGKYIFASLHREENLSDDKILTTFLQELNRYSKKVLFITHPRTKLRCEALGLYDNLKNVDYVSALSYKQTLSAIKNCAFLVTDSGAFQREAYYLQKRCLIRQDHAFWKTLTDVGIHRTIGSSANDLRNGIDWIEKKLTEDIYPIIDDLGDGNAGLRIIHSITELTAKKLTGY